MIPFTILGSERWSLRKIVAAACFAALEAVLVLVPLIQPLTNSLYEPVFLGCWLLAVGNFAWFVPAMRRWK